MCFHLGFVHAYIWDYGTDKERWAKPRETEQIIEEIYQKFVENNSAIQYKHNVSNHCEWFQYFCHHLRTFYFKLIREFSADIFFAYEKPSFSFYSPQWHSTID